MSGFNSEEDPVGYSQTLKTKVDLHISRKLFHFLGVMGMTFIYWQSSRIVALQLITFFAFLSIIIDLTRHQIPIVNRIAMKHFRFVMRDYEHHGMAGVSWLMIGAFVIILLFPKNVVTLSLLFLGIADPFASYIGIKYGKDKLIGNKSLQGTIGAFVACTFISVVFFYWQNLMTEQLIIVCIFSGLIGALSELIPIGKLDDNLTLPLISAVLLWGLLYIYGGL